MAAIKQLLPNDPPWLKAAFADLGLSEIPGRRHEKRVLAMYADAGHPEVEDDETAWCAAAVGAWLKRAGQPNSGSLMARSYAKYGSNCDLQKPVPRGAIIVWPRGKPPSGHVNIALADDGEFLTCIGGNQSNGSGGGVTISRERKSHALAARMPPGWSKPASASAVPLPKPKPVVEDEEEPQHVEPLPAPAEPVTAPAAIASDVQGDPELFSVQTRLKTMNYNPGIPNGVWGGMMSGAISGFVNDRHIAISVPSSLDMFNETRDALKLELSRAEAENWKRPVSELRASGDAAVVAQVAPEVVSVKSSYFATKWSAIVLFCTGLWNALNDKIEAAWNFFTDHKDNLPSDPSILSTAWSYVGKVPTFVWVLLGAVGLAYVSISSSKAVKRITESVQTGARQ